MDGLSETKRLYQARFGSPPIRVVRAPGRLELLGNHTDYNGGLVMSLAVDKYIYMAAGSRKDAEVHLVSSAFSGEEIFMIDRIEKNPAAPWANYVKGVLLELKRLGVHFTGFNAAIHGTIPFGAGLSSSAALEVATALTVRELHPFKTRGHSLDAAPAREDGKLPPLTDRERLDLARIGQAAESQFVGVNSGLLDQISSLFGKTGQVIQIDCLDHSVRHEVMPPGVALVAADSGVKHELSAGDYNELRRHCESAARKLGVDWLRRVTVSDLEQRRDQLTEREYECALHVTGEIQRVVFGERALRDGDIYQFGQYLFQSHASSRDHFKNSVPELDMLVEIAGRQKGCYGARLTGGGFGGATINLVQAEAVEEFTRRLAEEYGRRTGRRTEPWVCQAVDGAGAVT